MKLEVKPYLYKEAQNKWGKDVTELSNKEYRLLVMESKLNLFR